LERKEKKKERIRKVVEDVGESDGVEVAWVWHPLFKLKPVTFPTAFFPEPFTALSLSTSLLPSLLCHKFSTVPITNTIQQLQKISSFCSLPLPSKLKRNNPTLFHS